MKILPHIWASTIRKLKNLRITYCWLQNLLNRSVQFIYKRTITKVGQLGVPLLVSALHAKFEIKSHCSECLHAMNTKTRTGSYTRLYRINSLAWPLYASITSRLLGHLRILDYVVSKSFILHNGKNPLQTEEYLAPDADWPPH